MREIIVSNLMSLDGFIAGPNDEIDWFSGIADKEFEEYSVNLISSVDTMLFGRVTYQLMESYWPSATTATDDQRIIDSMNGTRKIVFSRTLNKPDWNNSFLVKENIVEEMSTLKQQPGKDIVIFGSGSIVSLFTKEKIIDKYKIFVYPVLLGSGKKMFGNIKERLNLKLKETRTFQSGVVLLDYTVVRR